MVLLSEFLFLCKWFPKIRLFFLYREIIVQRKALWITMTATTMTGGKNMISHRPGSVKGKKQKLPGSRETGWLSMTLIFDIFGKKDWYEIKSSTKKAENSKTLRGKLN